MNRLMLGMLGMLGGLVGLASLACTSTRSPEPELDPRVARLCGTWRAPSDDGTTIEERWQPSAEGLVGEGVMIDARGERAPTESFAIVLRPTHSTYRALPKGATQWTEFEQTDASAGDSTWTWSNPHHDFPQTIRYEFTAADSMRASVSGPDGEGGTMQFGWSYERVEACAD